MVSRVLDELDPAARFCVDVDDQQVRPPIRDRCLGGVDRLGDPTEVLTMPQRQVDRVRERSTRPEPWTRRCDCHDPAVTSGLDDGSVMRDRTVMVPKAS
jgi:hypothetical protein